MEEKVSINFNRVSEAIFMIVLEPSGVSNELCGVGAVASQKPFDARAILGLGARSPI